MCRPGLVVDIMGKVGLDGRLEVYTGRAKLEAMLAC